jgi:hypothetical protein
VADRRRSIPLRARTAKRFITSSKSKPDLRRYFKMWRAVFAAALCLVMEATLSLNTSSYEKRVGSKSRDAYGLCARIEKPHPLVPHIPHGGEHGYGDEEKDREDNHYMVGHRAPES